VLVLDSPGTAVHQILSVGVSGVVPGAVSNTGRLGAAHLADGTITCAGLDTSRTGSRRLATTPSSQLSAMDTRPPTADLRSSQAAVQSFAAPTIANRAATALQQPKDQIGCDHPTARHPRNSLSQ